MGGLSIFRSCNTLCCSLLCCLSSVLGGMGLQGGLDGCGRLCICFYYNLALKLHLTQASSYLSHVLEVRDKKLFLRGP